MKVRLACTRLVVSCAFSMALPLALVIFRAQSAAAQASYNLWAHGNLVATTVNHFDARKRNPDERAKMLKSLGITRFAYNWREPDVPQFDEEIEALQRNGIELRGWILYGADNPHTKTILEAFKRHHVSPYFWVYYSGESKKAEDTFPSPEKHAQRLSTETDKVEALARLAAPYGVKILLYNHNGWWGMVENQLALIERLRQRGVTGVGLVYNFTHARDEVHDDSKVFATLWPKMKPYVAQVNITGMNIDDVTKVKYPSQGDGEVEMMRIIQDSGWRGTIGIPAEKGGEGVNDAAVTLKNYIVGIDWIAAELKQPGSGGPRPFPPAS